MHKTISEIIAKPRYEWLTASSEAIHAITNMSRELEESRLKYGDKTKFVIDKTKDINAMIEFYNTSEKYEEYLRNKFITTAAMMRLQILTLKVMVEKTCQLLAMHKDQESFDEMKKFLQSELESIDKQLGE